MIFCLFLMSLPSCSICWCEEQRRKHTMLLCEMFTYDLVWDDAAFVGELAPLCHTVDVL